MSEPVPFADKAVNAVVRGLIAVARVLPYRMRVRAFGLLMAYVIAPAAGYLARARAHVAQALPDLSATAQARIARGCCDNAGRMVIELYSGAAFQARVEQSGIGGPGLAAVEAARAAGRPVLFITGHFGNFEAPRRALVARGFEISGIYRRMSNAPFNAHYEQTLQQVSIPVYPQDRSGIRGFLRHIRGGGMGTMLFDVKAEGADIAFLGRPAPTALSVAEFALRFDALLVPYFGIRRADGVHFDIEIEDPIAHSDPLRMMEAATARLEARIRAHPDQWFWVHRRW